MDAFLASRIMTDIFQGVASGITYSMIALCLVIIWRSTGVLNFAQGSMAMFAAFLGMTLVEHGVGYWWCLIISLLFGLAIGGATERILVRPLYGKPELNPIVVMVGLSELLQLGAGAIWGTTQRILPTPFSQVYYQLHGHLVQLSPFVLLQVALALGVMMIIAIVFQFTRLGLQMRAAAVAPEVARLLGVRVSRMLTYGWMISSGVGALAAVIVTTDQGTGISPTVMTFIFVYGFMAAAIGGLESPGGAVLGGLLIGLIEQFTSDYGNANLASIAGLILLIVVLVVRPQGLFTRHQARRV